MNSGTTPNGARALWWYALAILVIGLDQYTKALASALLDYGRPVEVFFWFDLTLQHGPVGLGPTVDLLHATLA